MIEPRTIAVVTGSRAEYGLLQPVMRAIEADSRLNLRVIAAGAHLLSPGNTIDDVAQDFEIASVVEMQSAGALPDRFLPRQSAKKQLQSQTEKGIAVADPIEVTERFSDAAALGRGIAGFAACFAETQPDVVLVLGDRIEAFAAAAAAAVAGIRIAHMHGGDRAEGIADESLRHALTKLAHIHLPATPISAQRIIAMGEHPSRVHVVGSPAIDGLEDIPPMSDAEFKSLGSPRVVVLLHPMGRPMDVEGEIATEVIRAVQQAGPVLLLHPNHDPGREGNMRAIEASGLPNKAHLPRAAFIGLLRRIHALVGNSSAGLIECAALGVPVVNIGNRQRGRERAENVTDVSEGDVEGLVAAIEQYAGSPRPKGSTMFGDGQTGRRVAELLATIDLESHGVAKCNTY